MTGKNKRELCFIFLLYLILSIILTFPLAVNFSRYPIFDHLDIALCFYNFWLQYYNLFVLKISPWDNILFNYPDIYRMTFFPLNLSYGVLSFPLQAIAGTPKSIPGFFHWISILSFTLTGFLGFLLFKKFSQSKNAGILAGILFTFIPFHYWHLPRCHISCLELVLLTMLCYFRLLETKTIRNGIYFGLSLIPLFYQSPNYLVYLLIFFSLHIVYILFTSRRSLDWKWLKLILLACSLALLFSAPYLIAIVKDIVRLPPASLSSIKEQTIFSTDIIGLVLPGFNQKLYSAIGNFAESLVGASGVSGKEIFPGYLLLLSGIAGIFLARKKIKAYGFWLSILLVCLVLSLGPYLNIASHTFTNLPLPYFFLRKIFPFFLIDRTPVRIIILAFLALAVFSAGFFCWLEQKIPASRGKIVLLALSAFGLLELNQAPIKLDRINLPIFFQQLAQEQEEFAILDLPYLPDIYQYSAFYQMYHKKYVVEYPIRKGAETFVNYPLYLYMHNPERFFGLGPEMQAQVKDTLRAEFKRRKIKYVIIWLKFIEENHKNNLDKLLNTLGPEKVFESENLFRVYQFKI